MDMVPGPRCELPKAWLSPVVPAGFALVWLHSLCSPGAHQSQRAGLSWQGSGWGPRWRWSRNAAGWSWHNPAGVCTCRHRGVRSQARATVPHPSPRPPCPATASGGLTGSPECTSRSRHRLRPRSPRRWSVPHTPPPSRGPSAGRGGSAEQGSRPSLVRRG